MTRPRFFMTVPKDHPPIYVGMSGGISCEKELCHHLVNVLRLHPKDTIELIERGSWSSWLCRLDTISGEDVRVTVLDALPQKPLPYRTTLFYGFSKGDKNDRIVRQATELGVARLMPVIFERSVSRPSPKRAVHKFERLQAIAQSAAEQSHRADIPDAREIAPFAVALKRLREDKPDLILVLWEEEEPRPLSRSIDLSALPDDPSVALVVGPEGGISQDEIAALRAAGAVTASLGPTILRVDTAVAAALSILQDTLSARHAS